MSLVRQLDQIFTFEFSQKIVPGVRFPARSTVICLEGGEVAILSPGPFPDAVVEEINRLGDVRYVIAPNLFHHFYFLESRERFPNAQLFAPPELADKIKSTRGQYSPIHELESAVSSQLRLKRMEGNSVLEEWVLYHEASQALLVTDLVFNMNQQPLMTRLMLKLAGAYDQLAQSRLIRATIKDKNSFEASVKSLAMFEPKLVVMAHGDVLWEMNVWSSFIQNYRA